MVNGPHTSARQQVLEGFVGTDILPIAFEHLDDRDRFNASLVCKSFSPPALDILWREMDRLDPLVPLFVSRENQVDDSNRRPKSLRFDAYRKRIRILHLGRSPLLGDKLVLHEAQVEAVLDMCQSLKKGKLLPNLTELGVFVRANSETNALIPFLLTLSLRGIDIRGRTPPPEQFFSLITALSPGVADFLYQRAPPRPRQRSSL
ncbi:hypothetical protein BKA70DRAFT_68774 [Coprinopsis sp. MPI-PUGE-AT-0042]|nr:hypothetical protein BKA70DRAFT_68774 [Coprinopsis sp. MPI-PUGE-AT-0042]